MRDFSEAKAEHAGAFRPEPGPSSPKGRAACSVRRACSLGSLIAAAVGLAGCQGTTEERTLPSVQVAMDHSLVPVYDDGELELYEVRLGVQLPILAPSAAERERLDGEPMSPYGTAPWVRLEDVRLQLSWTLTNLDDEPHTVEVLVDPWNEFAKYFPGLQLVDADEGAYLPNLSGIDRLYLLEPTSAGEGSRRRAIYTFDDLDEMARDFATTMNLIENPPTSMSQDPEDDPTVTYVNHAFAFQNHSERDLLVKAWLPPVVPALTGFDIALRTFEPAKVAIEVVAQVVDVASNRVKTEGRDGALLAAPTRVITVGSVAP
jgi:hypothetical protein